MPHTAIETADLHRSLYSACGLPALRMTYNDERAWQEFLLVMEPLEDLEGGKLNAADIRAVVAEMRRQNRAGRAGWALRPAKILTEPEQFRDLALMSRKPVRQRAHVERRALDVGPGQTMIDHDGHAEGTAQPLSGEALTKFLADCRRNL